MWEAWTLSQKLGIRPSELYEVDDGFPAFCFDRAVTMYGTKLEEAMRSAAKGAKTDKGAQGKAEQTFRKWIAVGSEEKVGMFRDPMKGMTSG